MSSGSQPSITPTPEDLIPTPGLQGHLHSHAQTHTKRHAPTYKYIFKKRKESSSSFVWSRLSLVCPSLLLSAPVCLSLPRTVPAYPSLLFATHCTTLPFPFTPIVSSQSYDPSKVPWLFLFSVHVICAFPVMTTILLYLCFLISPPACEFHRTLCSCPWNI